jgi:O-antigen ligase
MRWVLALLIALAATGLVAMLLTQSDDEYHQRRQESNIGRYAGIVVAARAIADSPIVGYGSWAGDKEYLQMLRSELARASAGKDVRTGRTGDSILPHSQLLQVWVEGGLLAAILFLLFGLSLLRGLRWLVLYHRSGPLTPLYALIIINGLWNLLFSPFLGMHRINVALALAVLSLLAWERSCVGQRCRTGKALA